MKIKIGSKVNYKTKGKTNYLRDGIVTNIYPQINKAFVLFPQRF